MALLTILATIFVASSFLTGDYTISQSNDSSKESFSEAQFGNDGMYYETPDLQNNELYEQSYVIDPLIGGGGGGGTTNDDIFVPNDSFRSAYFRNLKNNMPRNRLGICGYTGISMYISFFDTYWSDLFIDEKYESAPSTVSSGNITNSSPSQSPGVFNNITSNSPTMDTLTNIVLSQGHVEGTDEYKEALDRLIMQEIIDQIQQETFLGKLFSIALANGSITPHFELNEYYQDPNGYLDGIGVNYDIVSSIMHDYILQQPALVNNVSIVTSQMINDTQSEKTRIRNEIVQLVQSGKPVLMGGNGFTDTNGNGVRDLDIEDEFEWGHVIVAYEYDESTDTLYGNWGWSGQRAHESVDAYLNIRIHDYWCYEIGEGLPQTHTDHYRIGSSNQYVSPSGVILEKSSYLPNSYGFEPQYFFYEKTLSVSNENYIVSTKRLRTGYIENSFVNLSPHRENAGLAYLEIYSPTYINRFEFDASYWGSNEYVDKLNFSALVQFKTVNGNWITLIDLVRDINLSKNRMDQDHFSFILSAVNVTAIRIYYTDLIPFGSSNKGRISIGELNILHE